MQDCEQQLKTIQRGGNGRTDGEGAADSGYLLQAVRGENDQ